MQHSLHEDCPGFPTSSDREPPSVSWAAETTCSSVDHMQAAPPGSFFRQLFAEETDAAAGSYVEDLLQLQLPPAAEAVPPFDMLSSDIFHPRHDSYASSQLRRCVGELRVPAPFSIESYINNSGTTSAVLNTDHAPHTLEFVTPPTSTSSGLTFQGSSSSVTSTISRTQGAAASALLPDAQVISPSDSDHDGVHHSKPSLVTADDGDELHTAASSCKKAKIQSSEQCNSAGADPSQTMIGKVQSVRSKEKLGERINALQQLVSPFGKTDTASVLSEAIGYIKFLQEQVQVLSSPYMKPTSTLMTASSRQDVGAESASDLRSRGLCLVPVSCTINVANNNNFNIGADYWASTPSLGGTAGGSASTARFSASS